TDAIVATAVINGQEKTATASKEWVQNFTCDGITASVTTLWPPNHKFVPITFTGVPSSGQVVVTGITQDEPINSLGDGSTCPDAVIANGAVRLRAERFGRGNGRVYTIAFTAGDGRSCSVDVCVPRDSASGTCVKDALVVNSLGPCDGGPGLAEPDLITDVRLQVLEVGRSRTALEYSLPAEGDVMIAVYDIA